jgi:oligoribonuclease NrnB/cAMP/cGMP phosphodiesterase (DHH superfamily)
MVQLVQHVRGNKYHLVCIDHHESAVERMLELKDRYQGTPHRFIIDTDYSACSLTMRFFQLSSICYSPEVCMLVKYVQDRDLWRFKLPESEVYNMAVSLLPYDFDAWEKFSERPFSDVVAEGRILKVYRDRLIGRLIQNAREVKFYDGHIVRAVNAPVLQSEVAGSLAKDSLFGVAYWQRADGKFQFSLRSRQFNVAEYAQKHGGGGHPKAAGFEKDTLPYTLQLLDIEKPKREPVDIPPIEKPKREPVKMKEPGCACYLGVRYCDIHKQLGQ